MSGSPPYDYRPTNFVPSNEDCVAPQYIERRSRLNAGLNGKPFFRSRYFGTAVNNIAIEITGTVNNNPSPGIFPPAHAGDDTYILYLLTFKVYYLDIICMEYSWTQYYSSNTVTSEEDTVTTITVTNGLNHLQSVVNDGASWYDGSVLFEHLPAWARTKADVLTMPIRGNANTNDFYDNYLDVPEEGGRPEEKPAFNGSNSRVFLTPKTYLTGGSGGPADASGLASIRTGPERTVAIIRETETDRGFPTKPQDIGKAATIQWDGGNWVDYVPNSD